MQNTIPWGFQADLINKTGSTRTLKGGGPRLLYGNALAEMVIGLYKAEVIHPRGPWRGAEAVEFTTLEWVDWFNIKRLLEEIGYMPPAEAEARCYAQSSGLAMVV